MEMSWCEKDVVTINDINYLWGTGLNILENVVVFMETTKDGFTPLTNILLAFPYFSKIGMQNRFTDIVSKIIRDDTECRKAHILANSWNA